MYGICLISQEHGTGWVLENELTYDLTCWEYPVPRIFHIVPWKLEVLSDG
jgi:hypothetical protein